MSQLGRRLRSRRDYLLFQVTNEWPILLSATGVVVGAATLLPTGLAIALSVIAFLVGLGALLHDLRQLRRRWSEYEFSSIAAPFPTGSIPPPASYPDPVYLYVPNRGTALLSDAIDSAIASHLFEMRVDEEPYRLPRTLKASAPYVLPVTSRGRLVFNGKVVGMRSDPLPPGTFSTPIRLHVAHFFDSQCSNEMCGLRITHRDTGEEFDPRQNLLVNANGQLCTLSESTLADVIGISTVAMTTDEALVLVRQTRRNVGSPMLLAPSGSGSLHPMDLGQDGAGKLQDVVRRGMERELCEETGIRPDEIRSTTVLGFARWLERGAKPEFFGVTELSVTEQDLAARRHLPSGERLYSGGMFTVRIDLGALGRDLVGGSELLDAPSLPARIGEDGSLPLLLDLRAAARWRAKVSSN